MGISSTSCKPYPRHALHFHSGYGCIRLPSRWRPDSIFSRMPVLRRRALRFCLTVAGFETSIMMCESGSLLTLTVGLKVDQDVVDTSGRAGIDGNKYGGLSPSSSFFLPSPSLQSCTLETSVVWRSLCLWSAFCLSVIQEVVCSCHCSPTWILVQHVNKPPIQSNTFTAVDMVSYFLPERIRRNDRDGRNDF